MSSVCQEKRIGGKHYFSQPPPSVCAALDCAVFELTQLTAIAHRIAGNVLIAPWVQVWPHDPIEYAQALDAARRRREQLQRGDKACVIA